MVSKRSRKVQKRDTGPHVYIPSGRKYYYYGGSFKTTAGNIVLKGSTGIRHDEPLAEQRANGLLHKKKIPELISQYDNGKKPTIAWVVAIDQYLTDRYPDGCMKQREEGMPLPLNATARVGQELAAHFRNTLMGDTTADDINEYYLKRFAKGQSKATKRRHQVILDAIYKFKRVAIPDYDKAVPRVKRGQGVRKKLEMDEISLLIDCISPRLRLFLVLDFLIGGRVSELLYIGVSNLPGAAKLVFEKTKNDEARIIDLPEWVQVEVKAHFERNNALIQRYRGKRIFFTYKNQPYRDYEGHGGQIRAAFNVARKRAATILEEQGRLDRADVMRMVTPHWARHTFANTLLDLDVNERDIQITGNWKSVESLRNNYLSDRRDVVKETVKMMNFNANKPQQISRDHKNSGKSKG